jgi:hypothetical protein
LTLQIPLVCARHLFLSFCCHFLREEKRGSLKSAMTWKRNPWRGDHFKTESLANAMT